MIWLKVRIQIGGFMALGDMLAVIRRIVFVSCLVKVNLVANAAFHLKKYVLNLRRDCAHSMHHTFQSKYCMLT